MFENKISVIMAYFDKKKYVESSIDSVLNQSHKDLELIIIYDDETKKDLKFLQTLSKKDKRIKLIINEKNLGAGESRNKGIRLSKSNFISFIDSDDLWDIDKLKIQINFMIKNGLSISHTSYKIIDKLNYKIGSRKSIDNLSYKDLLKSCDIGLSTVMMKKNLIDNNYKFANLKTKEDYVLWLKLAKKGLEFKLIDIELTSWRKLDKSLSSSVLQKLKDGYLVYSEFMKFNFLKSFYYLIRLSIYSLMR